MKIFRILTISLLCISLFTFCTKNSEKHTPDKDEATLNKSPENSKQVIEFSEEEKEYITALRKKGKIVAAMREVNQVYIPLANGSIKGFNYNLVKSMTDYLGIKLEIKVVKFSDYFIDNGMVPEKVKTDATYTYVPDLLEEVDIYVDTITILPWREKLMLFVKIIPTRVVLITRKEEKISSLGELDHKKAAVMLNTSYEMQLKKMENDLQIKVECQFVENDADLFELVGKKQVDFTLRDSNRAIADMKKYTNLDISMPVSGLQDLAWAVKRDNSVLAGIITKFIAYTRKSGLMNKHWLQDTGLTLEEYYELIEYE